MTGRLIFVVTAIALSLSAGIALANQITEDPVRIKPESLNVRENSLGRIEILGEVENTSSSHIGFVRVAITIKDSTGKVLATGFTYVDGKDVTIGSTTTSRGIFPGESAPFSNTFFSDVKLADAANIEYAVTYSIAEPRADFPDAPILVRLAELEAALGALRAEVDGLKGQPTTSGLLGDLNGDGRVNFSDFLLFAENFGKAL